MEKPAYCKQCGAKLSEEAKFCAACGAPVTESDTDPNTPATQSNTPDLNHAAPDYSFPPAPEKGWPYARLEAKSSIQKPLPFFYNAGCIVAAMLCFLFVLVIIASNGFTPAKNKSSYTSCLEQLSNVKTGVESYMSENDSLKGANLPDDLCNHILPGFDNAAECSGLVQKRIYAVCAENTFSIKTIDGFTYEIRAQSKKSDKKRCKICVTELTATPDIYEDCSLDMEYICLH